MGKLDFILPAWQRGQGVSLYRRPRSSSLLSRLCFYPVLPETGWMLLPSQALWVRHPGNGSCGATIATPGLKGQARTTVLTRACFPVGTLKENEQKCGWRWTQPLHEPEDSQEAEGVGR